MNAHSVVNGRKRYAVTHCPCRATDVRLGETIRQSQPAWSVGFEPPLSVLLTLSECHSCRPGAFRGSAPGLPGSWTLVCIRDLRRSDMKTTLRTRRTLVGASAVALLLSAAPLFAAPQQGYDRDRDNNRYDRNNNDRRNYRENDRIERDGRIRTFTRERDGYRIYLENEPGSFWVPAARIGRNLSVGLNIHLGGVYRSGNIYVDAVGWPGGVVAPGYGAPGYVAPGVVPGRMEVRGVVERISYRSNTMWLRDHDRIIKVDMRDRALRDLRP